MEIYDIIGLETFANRLSKSLKVGDVLCLQGDLGVGKTTLAGFIINALMGHKQNITSPTFNLLNTYIIEGNKVIWHFDLYRLNSLLEALNLGIEDAFKGGITIIEWPEIISKILPDNTMLIKLQFAEEEGKRLISIIPHK